MLEKLTILNTYLQTHFRLRFYDRPTLVNWQSRKIDHFIKNTLARSPFYQKYLHMSIENFPIMTKALMMENFDTLNTLGIKKQAALNIALRAEEDRNFSPKINGVTVGLSSGTSGHRGLFLVSPHECLKWAGIVLARVIPGQLTHHHKIAFFFRANSNLYETLQMGKRIQFGYYDLMVNFASNLERLHCQQPDILVGPPQVLRKIAQAQQKGKIQIAPSRVISIAEVLDPLDQSYIEGIFSVPLHQIYQCTEGFLGVSCPQGRLHLNEEFIHIEKEWLDDEKIRFVPVITDFTRSTQPMVRYRLDDILVESQKSCPCGSATTVLERIEGRCDDIFRLRAVSNQKEEISLLPDLIRHTIVRVSEAVTDYRVIQHDFDRIEIQIQSQAYQDDKDKISKGLTNLINRVGAQVPKLSFSPYIAPDLSKKLRRIERRFDRKIQ